MGSPHLAWNVQPEKHLPLIAKVLGVTPRAIHHIRLIDQGMTNDSFAFTCQNRRYIMRVPGAGSNQLVDRKKEADVYAALSTHHITEPVVYLDQNTGYKLSEFVVGARNADANDAGDVTVCMQQLRLLHERRLKVAHEFDLAQEIERYERLWLTPSRYADYRLLKRRVLALVPRLKAQADYQTLCHIDANPDNFLMAENKVHLIDWEYAGMQDPHIDVAMFCLYALYDRRQIDATIEAYFEGAPSAATRKKIYGYIACCGLLWSNWCEYKAGQGIDFGDYALRQYQYARDYIDLAQ